MVWPPTKDFTDFIASLVENSELCFDPKITDTVSGADEESRYAGHCLLWARTSALGIGEIKLKALVNMHLRFDGFLGFPGGFIEHNETIIDGVSREVQEEMAFNQSMLKLTTNDFVCRTTIPYQKSGTNFKKMNLFFFSKEISEDDFIQMEENSKKAEHFGSEILGIIRVPVYFWREKGGFPTFLTNAFACTAKPQLLLALYKNGILTKEEIMESYKLLHQK